MVLAGAYGEIGAVENDLELGIAVVTMSNSAMTVRTGGTLRIF
jgi:hypothetical protein